MWRKILGWIVLLIMLGGTICGIVFGVKYNELIHEDKEEKYLELEEKHNALQSSYDKIVFEQENINSQLYSLNIENEANKALIIQLQSDKADLENLVAELESQAEINAETIADLQSQITGKENEIVQLTTTINTNNEIISELEAEKASLQSELLRLQTMMENYIIEIIPTEEEYSAYVSNHKKTSGGAIGAHIKTEYYPALNKINIVSRSATSSRVKAILVRSFYITESLDTSNITFAQIDELIDSSIDFSSIEYESISDIDLHTSLDTETLTFGVYYKVSTDNTKTVVSSYGLGLIKDENFNVVYLFQLKSRIIELENATEESITEAKSNLTEELFESAIHRVEILN